jgi:hypothetical protein
MTDWINTAQEMAAMVAAIVASMVAWWNLGLPRAVFSPEAPIHARIAVLEQLNCDTRLLVLDQARWSAIRTARSGRRRAWRADRTLAEAALVGRMTPLLQTANFG